MIVLPRERLVVVRMREPKQNTPEENQRFNNRPEFFQLARALAPAGMGVAQ